ncbi:MAG: DNA gyrase subunit A [Chlamydiales bacterium]|nr:DNA gyrase subunit A [Chlamydiales bacterium]
MEDFKHVFKENYLRYASYVILDRAIPHVIDGLKPVQRRILWTLFQMDDGKLHKVANVAGQTMALHPHGDAPIIDALVNLANKGYLLDTQGNFGNPHTGDPAAAARYIETRLGGLAKETLFNPALTEFLSSYDGRNQEPAVLPAKIPLLLMQGAEGIAVGMSTKVLPHNFQELLKAEIAILEGKTFEILPDFPSGGIMDPSEYNQGRGKVKLRAKITSPDDKTLIITEICHGTTTESVIRSIDEAAKKGKIKIDSINDYTAEKIEIEIKLPRGQYADTLIDQLYAFTDCEVSISTQLLCIKEQLPWEGTVNGILELHVELLKGYLKKELEMERDRLLERIFEKTLEQIFIENRLYKKIEDVGTYEKIHSTIEKSLQPFHKQLARIPTREDQERLLAIPIRRISRFDIEKNQEDIAALDKKLMEVEKHLKNIKKFTINYLQGLLKKYGSLFPRRTRLKEIEVLDKREIAKRMVKVGYDSESGYMGTKVSSPHSVECSTLDKLLVLFKDGTYQVMNIPEKQYIHTKKVPAIWIGPADKQTIFRVLYRDKATQYAYAKRFIVKQFILDKEYQFLDGGHKLEFISTEPGIVLQLTFKPKARQKVTKLECALDEVAIKSVSAKGVRIANKELKTVKIYKSKGA